jgi:hypothetical protein
MTDQEPSMPTTATGLLKLADNPEYPYRFPPTVNAAGERRVGYCRLRVYRDDSIATVLCVLTDPPQGAMGSILAALGRTYARGDTWTVRVFEHRPRRGDVREVSVHPLDGNPDWTPLDPAAVAAMIGEPL